VKKISIPGHSTTSLLNPYLLYEISEKLEISTSMYFSERSKFIYDDDDENL